MKWSNKETFVKTAGEIYRNTANRDDITVNTRCGSMIKNRRSFIYSTVPCTAKRLFICQIFASDVKPIAVDLQPNLKASIHGVYRPMIGVTYKGSAVYQRQTIPKFHLYRISRGDLNNGYHVLHSSIPLAKFLMSFLSLIRLGDWRI